MTIIHKYVARLFFKYFGMVLGMVIVIYLSIDFFGRIDKFMGDQTPPFVIASFFLYKIPLIAAQITPVAVLLGVLSAFGLMVKNNEVLALKSGGVSLYYLLLPIAVIGAAISMALFVFSEAVVPICISKANRIEEGKPDSRMMTSTEENIWIRGNRSIIHIAYYNPSDQTISGVSIAYFDQHFTIARRIDARMGRYVDGGWELIDCLIQTRLDDPSQNPEVIFHDKEIIPLDLAPSDLQRVTRESQEMPFFELYRYILKVETEGYDATKYRVDFYAKTAFPFICLIIAMFGAGLALRGSTRDGMVISFAYGILTAFVYWSFYSFCLSLGYGRVLPPVAAAWAANLIFFCAAGLAVYNLE